MLQGSHSFLSVSAASANSSQSLNKVLVHVPQGCFAEVRPEDNVILAAGTAGIDPCCHVVIANKTNGHFIFCHADALTNLTDESNGIPSWIKKVCPDGNYENLSINIGENPSNPRLVDNAIYYNQVMQSLQLVAGCNKEKAETIITASITDMQYDAIIEKRDNAEPKIVIDKNWDDYQYEHLEKERVKFNGNIDINDIRIKPDFRMDLRDLHQLDYSQSDLKSAIDLKMSEGFKKAEGPAIEHLKEDAKTKGKEYKLAAPICSSIGAQVFDYESLEKFSNIKLAEPDITISISGKEIDSDASISHSVDSNKHSPTHAAPYVELPIQNSASSSSALTASAPIDNPNWKPLTPQKPLTLEELRDRGVTLTDDNLKSSYSIPAARIKPAAHKPFNSENSSVRMNNSKLMITIIFNSHCK